MSESTDTTFDAGAYWRDRVVAGADLGVVGHRSMGPVYNRYLYERRVEVLEEMLLRHASSPLEDLRVLDIGCGSGFYTAFWAAKGVRDYVGVDISQATVEHLSSRFPDYRFLQLDATESGAAGLADFAPFDIITVFDVLYHIVDDGRFANAISLTASVAGHSSCVFVIDHVFARRYQLSRHVVYRARGDYLGTFGARGLQLVDDELLFHYMLPPLSGSRATDLLAAAIFKAAGFVLRMWAPLASRAAAALRGLDSRLRDKGKRVANSEFLVFRKTER